MNISAQDSVMTGWRNIRIRATREEGRETWPKGSECVYVPKHKRVQLPKHSETVQVMQRKQYHE